MKSKDILNAEVESFVKDSSTSFDTIRNVFVSKVDLGNNLIGVFAQSEFNNLLQFVYNTTTQEIVLITNRANRYLFKKDSIEETLSYSTFIELLNKAIKVEFKDVIESLEVDELLYKDKTVEELVEIAKKYSEPITYDIPQMSISDNIPLTDIAYLCSDIHEGAYSFLEKYLKANPAFIRNCQRVLVANELFSKKLKSEGFDYSWQDIRLRIQRILSTTTHKSVNICYELGDGTQETVSLKITQTLIKGLPPTYSIVKITWKNEVLYDRDELKKDIKAWKAETSENEEFLTKGIHNYNQTSFIPKFYSFFSEDLFNNKQFCLRLIDSSDWKERMKFIPRKFKEDVDFIGEFIEKNYYIRNYLVDLMKDEAFIKLFPQFEENEKFYIHLCKANPESFEFFPLEMKQNTRVIATLMRFEPPSKHIDRYYSIPNIATKCLTKEVLSSDKLINFVEGLAKSYPDKVSVGYDIVDKFKDRNIILLTYQYTMERIDPSKIPSKLKSDKDWILKLLKGIRDFNFDSFYSSLSTELKYDDDVISLIFKYRKSSDSFRNKLIKSGKITINTLYKLLLDEKGDIDEEKARALVDSFEKETLFQLLELNPKLIKYYVQEACRNLKSAKEVDEAIKFAVKLDYQSIENISSYYITKSVWLELLKIDNRVFEFIPLQDYSEAILEFMGNTRYIMEQINSLRGKWPNIYTKFALDKEFIRKQAKFNSEMLKDVLPIDKRFSSRDSDSLQEDKEFVLELIELNPENIYGLAKRSKFWKDLDFAKKVVALNPGAMDLFPKSIIKQL